MSLAQRRPFRLGETLIAPATREVRGPGGATTVEPRVMQVLMALVDAGGALVTREELLQRCWNGLFVGDDALNRAVAEVRRVGRTAAAGSFAVETIPRTGYRLAGAEALEASETKTGVPRGLQASPVPAASGKPSLAVLPFANLSGDPDQDFFADGMVEEISTALTRFHSLFVVAGGSGLSLKGQGLTPQEAGRRLGVCYLLDGAVRRAADRIRISVTLIDAHDGVQLWANRFDGNMSDIFSLQDEVALSAVAQIEPQIQAEETRRAHAKPAANLDAYDLFLRAGAIARSDSRAALMQAQPLFEQCLALDPDYARALAACALGHSFAVAFGWAADEEAERALARERMRAALRLAPNDEEVLTFATTVILNLQEDTSAAHPLIEQALAVNPGYARGWKASGWLRTFTDPDIAAEHLERCLKLDPLSPGRASTFTGLGVARLGQRRLDDAIALFRQAAQLAADYPTNHAMLAVCYAHLGQLLEAREAATKFRATSGRTVLEWADRVGASNWMKSRLTRIPDV